MQTCQHCISSGEAGFEDINLNMHTPAEEELTRILLKELLSHQFCSPVQWIETQREILGGPDAAERIIEIGPSATLVNMAKKTLAKSFQTQDIALGRQRTLLSYGKNADDIYYRCQEPDAEPEPEPVPVLKKVEPVVVNEAPAPLPPPAQPAVLVPKIQDVPLAASDVLLTIASLSLRKPRDQIPQSESLKQLCGGRSTLQNEVIGDLVAEFGALPDQPEDLPLSELSSALERGSPRTLGPCINSRISKFASSKMPAGLGISVLKQYLASRWGLGPGLQDKVLLTVLTEQPTARLVDEDQLKVFLDKMAQETLKSAGIEQPDILAVSPAVVDVSPLVAPGQHFGSEPRRRRRCSCGDKASSKAETQLKLAADELRSDLDLWVAEHGDFYGDNIQPKFDPKKARAYDSSWNWVVQDFLRLVAEKRPFDRQEINLFQARANPRLLEIIDFMTKAPGAPGDKLLPVMKLIAQEVGGAPLFRSTAGHIHSPVAMLKMHEPIQFSDDKHADFKNHDASFSSSRSVSSITMDTPDSESYEMMTPFIKVKGKTSWHRDSSLSIQYLSQVSHAAVDGITFHDKAFLVTGAGTGSIGAELVKIVLTAGAKVVVPTSSFSTETAAHWQNIYASYGGRGSRLVVAPFNGGSRQDVSALVKYIYETLGWDLDCIVPFAAVGEAGRNIDSIDSKSEFAHRLMLTNVVRLLGAVKAEKEARRIRCHPTQVLLPLSPNHGVFGTDGLYAESKLGLEALLNKQQSERWGTYLSVCGAVIGWTRGTGLMGANDFLAETLEKVHGMKTFSVPEMATYLACLLTGPIASHCEIQPLVADISGNMSSTQNLRPLIDKIQADLQLQSEMDAVSKTDRQDQSKPSKKRAIRQCPRMEIDSYTLPTNEEIEPLRKTLEGMVDLEQVVVIAGFGEVGPCGSSRTRWELEIGEGFSLEGCIEMAWMMGMVKYHNGLHKGKRYCGWLDTATGEPITDLDAMKKYEENILSHSGIRFFEPREHDPEDTSHQRLLHEVLVTEDLDPFEIASAEVAEDLRRHHGDDKVEILDGDDGRIMARLRAGATLMIPKATRMHKSVGAQVPSGWDAKIYGISDDIISQVDPATLYTIVATVEALLSAGITDPFELYRHLHVSDVAVCIGAGLGGVTSMRNMFKERLLDKRHVQRDILAETFINTTGAWVNMLLLGSSGPIRTPVGACATALESVDTGFDLISSGKAKACLVGGFDGLELDVAVEFANMKATINTDNEMAAGREPKQMSRPTASSRAGFVEAEGSGIQLMTTAQLALDMGLPIHAVIALTHTASDKIGRSVPAPGRGLLTVVKEAPSRFPPPLLNMAYRRRNIELRKSQIAEKRNEDLEALDQQEEQQPALDEWIAAQRQDVDAEAARSLRDAYSTYGNSFWRGDSRISPLRGSLAVWGLTVDDIGVASLHGTSTVKNDINETAVLQQQLSSLGRKPGNVLPCVCQKWLTGHAKGAAGAFALNGCLQMLSRKTIPGNRNADNIDEHLQETDILLFPNRPLAAADIKAFSVTSFGFGQKGAQVVGVHPRYVLAAIPEPTLEEYRGKLTHRRRRAYRFFQDGFYGNKLVQPKDQTPYKEADMEGFLVDAGARVSN